MFAVIYFVLSVILLICGYVWLKMRKDKDSDKYKADKKVFVTNLTLFVLLVILLGLIFFVFGVV